MLRRLFLTLLSSITTAGAEISFNQDIRPILSSKCIVCHGPDDGVDAKGKANRKAGLRLDTPEGAYAGKKGITAIVPGSLTDSEAWIRISDADDPMPPLDGHAKPLTSGEKELLKQWIEQGAEYEDFWAFVPVKKQNPPAVKNTNWPKSDIDQFTLARIEAKGKQPKSPADKRTLIRRLSLDLTGLPPTSRKSKTFLDDTAPEAYQRLVDRLTAKPALRRAHGQVLARPRPRRRHQRQPPRPLPRPRPPTATGSSSAFNENLPYDEFAAYQLAGDLYPNPTDGPARRLRLQPPPPHHRPRHRPPRRESTSTMSSTASPPSEPPSWASPSAAPSATTTNTTRSPQKDFYQLYAFFNNLDATPKPAAVAAPTSTAASSPPTSISPPTNPENPKLADLEPETKQDPSEKPSRSSTQTNPSPRDPSPRSPKLRSRTAVRQRSTASPVPAAMVMNERADIHPAHILIRGAYDNPGDEVTRDTPHFLPPLKKAGDVPSRLDLANWLRRTKKTPSPPASPSTASGSSSSAPASSKHPKTSAPRAMWPSHPDLLDHLTLNFVELRLGRQSTHQGHRPLTDLPAILRRHSGRLRNATPGTASSPAAPAPASTPKSSAISSSPPPDSSIPTWAVRSVKTPQPDGLWKMRRSPQLLPQQLRTRFRSRHQTPQYLHLLETRPRPAADDHLRRPHPRRLHRPPRAHQHPPPGTPPASTNKSTSAPPAPSPPPPSRTSRSTRPHASAASTRPSPPIYPTAPNAPHCSGH